MNPTKNILFKQEKSFKKTKINNFQEAVQTIYSNILTQYLSNGFQQVVAKYALNIVNTAIALHTRISQSFLPTAIKFHYIFNLRDLSNIFQVYKKKLFLIFFKQILIYENI